MITENIKTYLLTATIADLIDTRLFPSRMLPNGTRFPAVNYFVVSRVKDHVTDVTTLRVQFSNWGRSLEEAWSLCEALEVDLIRFKGNMGGKKIQQVVFISSQEIFEPDPKKFLVPADYKFFYREEN